MHTYINNTTMRKLRGGVSGAGEQIFSIADLCELEDRFIGTVSYTGQSDAAPFVSHH